MNLNIYLTRTTIFIYYRVHRGKTLWTAFNQLELFNMNISSMNISIFINNPNPMKYPYLSIIDKRY